MSLADIADLMGHKDLSTTQIYAKVEQEHLRAVVTKLAPLIPEPPSLKTVTQGDSAEKENNKLLIASGLEEERK